MQANLEQLKTPNDDEEHIRAITSMDFMSGNWLRLSAW